MADMTTQERLDRLERDVSLLARVRVLPEGKVTFGEFQRLQEISERFPRSERFRRSDGKPDRPPSTD